MAEMFREHVQTFIDEQVVGREQELDAPDEIPHAIYETFRAKNLANWWIPRAYGGHGLSLEESVDVVIDLAYADAGLAFAFFLPILSSTPIQLYGSESQRRTYLTEMARSGTFGATMASERVAGSELIRLGTVAEKAEGGFRLTGEKFFSTNAALADYFIVYAAMSGDSARFAAFVVAGNSEGVEILRRWPTVGVRAAGTYELALRDCSAGPPLPGNGLRILEVGLNASRTLMAASAVGIGRRIRDVCLEYARGKEVKGKPLLENDVFGAKIGQMQAELEAMASLCRAAARDFDEVMQRPDAPEAFLHIGSLKSVLVAKMMCGQLGGRIAGVGAEALGGLGYTEESLLGKLVRDMRYVAIVEAGEDVLRDLLYVRHTLPAFLGGRR
ncbi:acyl-CoA dehydrogenase family protein [Sorangium sp. So ce269]